jgi:signal transduction histidine kinase
MNVEKGLKRHLIERAALFTFGARAVEGLLTAGLLGTVYRPAITVPEALVGLLAAYLVGNAALCARYRRGRIDALTVLFDVCLNSVALLAAVQCSGGISSPLTKIFLVKIAGYSLIFSRTIGRISLAVACLGLAAITAGTFLGALPAASLAFVSASAHARVDLAITAAIFLMIFAGLGTILGRIDAKETELQQEAAKAQEAARFQASAARIACATNTEGDLEHVLRIVCDEMRQALGGRVVVLWLREGEHLLARACAGGPPGLVGERVPIMAPDSMAATALRTSEPILMPNLAAATFTQDVPRRETSGISALAVPIIGKTGPIGALMITADSADLVCNEPLRQRAEILTAQAAAAIERARLLVRVQEEAGAVRLLLGVSEKLSGATDLNEILRTVNQAVVTLLDSDVSTTRLWNGSAFVSAAQYGYADDVAADLREMPFTPDHPVAARVLKGETVVLEPGAASVPDPIRLAERARIASAAVAPMVIRGHILGLVSAARRTGSKPYSPEEVRLLEGITRQTALAVANARLHESERDAASVATALLDVARELNEALDPQEVLTRLSRRTRELVGCDVAAFTLWDPRARAFTLEAIAGVEAKLEELLLHTPFAPDRFGQRRELAAAGILESDDAAVRNVIPEAALSGLHEARILNVSMERQGELIGVLSVVNWDRTRYFAPRQARLAQGIASHAATALQNARLFADLREANRLKSDFVATMSHELRTPLNIIMGYTDLLLEDAFGAVDPAQRNIVERVQRASRELFELITATLDLNRLEAGRSHLALENLAVPDLFRQLGAETAELLTNELVEMRWEHDPALPVLVTDRTKVRIILKNLIGNALKFTQRGSVSLSARHRADDHRVVFEVVDTGIGMRAEDLPMIFEMFRQIENVNTRRHGGVGLGLYIVKRLVDQLGGDIRVESAFGRGSRFEVTLPVIAPGAEPPAPAPPAPPRQRTSSRRSPADPAGTDALAPGGAAMAREA